MRTFKGSISIGDLRIVVPDTFLAQLRKDAEAEDATFLKVAHAQHPRDDDAFLTMVLRNGLRVFMRHNLAELFGSSGLGLTVAPAQIELIPAIPDFNSDVEPQVIDVDRKIVEPAHDTGETT